MSIIMADMAYGKLQFVYRSGLYLFLIQNCLAGKQTHIYLIFVINVKLARGLDSDLLWCPARACTSIVMQQRFHLLPITNYCLRPSWHLSCQARGPARQRAPTLPPLAGYQPPQKLPGTTSLDHHQPLDCYTDGLHLICLKSTSTLCTTFTCWCHQARNYSIMFSDLGATKYRPACPKAVFLNPF